MGIAEKNNAQLYQRNSLTPRLQFYVFTFATVVSQRKTFAMSCAKFQWRKRKNFLRRITFPFYGIATNIYRLKSVCEALPILVDQLHIEKRVSLDLFIQVFRLLFWTAIQLVCLVKFSMSLVIEVNRSLVCTYIYMQRYACICNCNVKLLQ